MNKQIKLNDKLNGTIRYLGPVEGKEGEWAGIELNHSIGKNNGTYLGKKYFECKDNYGLFIKYKRIVENKGNGADYCLKDGKYELSKSQIEFEKSNESNYNLNFSLFDDEIKEQDNETNGNNNDNKTNMSNSMKENENRSMIANGSINVKEDRNEIEMNKKYELEIELLKFENRRIKLQNKRYIEMFNKLVKNVRDFTKKISDSISKLQNKVNVLLKTTVKKSEKDRVRYLIRNLYFDKNKENKNEIQNFYNEFKDIMYSHGIKV